MTHEPDAARIRKSLSPSVRAARYAFALAIVVCLAVGIYLTVEDESSGLAVKLSGLGINLIAAAAFSTIFALLVDRENRSLAEDRLDDRFDAHASKILKAVSNLNTAYLPAAVHPPGQGYDTAFNRNLMNDLNHSSYYYFRGPSAKYVAARLGALRRRPDLVRIYVPGPASTASIKFFIANKSRTRSHDDTDVVVLNRKFADDLLSALIALFDCRAYGRIEVFLCEDTLVARHEVTEQHLYTSWYTSLQNSRGDKFPETTEFARSSIHYQAMMIDMDRRASFAGHSLIITPELGLGEFVTQLEAIFGKSYTPDEITSMAKVYWEDRSDFLAFLGTL
jgi:hypothetical protein